ncbi:MAG: RNA-binding domain-containing protein [Candidatus Heimdallarchaeaceae archaeon]
MDITISKVECSFSVHATENFDKNMEALENLIPDELIEETEIVIEELEGGYENPIEYVVTSFSNKKLVTKILEHIVSKLSKEQKMLLYDEFEERFNQDKKSFHIRIDKQGIYNNQLIISSATNVIKIEIKLRSYIKDVDYKQFLIDKSLLSEK